jgi:glycosyltransferase involved in cell wall biosynthesis
MQLSVVIPAYDCEAYVGEAVRSALEQSFADLEVIVVDDGSTDRTGDAARAAIRDDPRARVLRQSNAGVMAARRAGFAASRGEATIFLDGDDRLRPNALERFAKALTAHPEVGAVYGDRVLMNDAGRTFGSESGALLNPRPTGDVLRRFLRRNFLSTPGQACFRSCCLANAEALKLQVRRAVDWVLYCEIAATDRFAYVGRGPVVEYRLWSASMARSLADTGGRAADIDELLPAIDAIYSLTAVTERLDPRDVAALRRVSVASAFAWKGQELLRARRWGAARAYFLRALRHWPVDPRDVLCLALTYARAFPPGTKRFVGVP